ncbi:Gfo/Idh/MocA family protein [Paenibacillus sp. sgz500958]|uniref:Gfo/Idh/MocA family protein n=1 Tax=Paenibacillus sp. sgz500958 TaxID=3242475 RepID=UPI0036D2871B
MNIGVLGTGFGAYHAKLFSNMGTVGKVVVYGRNPEKLQQLQKELNLEVTTKIEDILLDPDIGVVDICLPSNLHRFYAIEAMKNGKDVLCETPVCLNADDLNAMILAQEQYARRIFVNQFIKFDPAYQYLYESVRNRTYGKLLSFTLRRETSPLWGNLGLDQITANLMIHDLDFMVWMFGSTLPYQVWGTHGIDKDQAIVHLTCELKDTFAEILSSSQMPAGYPFTVGYEAYFESAKLVFQEINQLNGEVTATLDEYTSSVKRQLELIPADPYEKSLSHMVQCVEDGSSSILSLEHASHSLSIALEAQQRLMRL